MSIETIWLVRNYGLDEANHRTSLEILLTEHPVITQLVCFSEDKEKNHYLLDATQLRALSKQVGDKIIVHSEERTLNPRGKEGSAVYVVWKYQITKLINDSDILSFGATTMGVTINVQCDQDTLEVDLESLSKFKKLYDHKWTFDKSQVFFKEQHIRLRWWSKKHQ